MTLVRQILAALAQFITVVLIARELGAEGNGTYAMVILFPTMLANFFNLGIGPATVYFISRKEFSARDAFGGNLRLAFVISLVGIVAAVCVLNFWGAELFPEIPLQILYFGLISFPLTLSHSYLNTILQGLEIFRAFNLSILLPPFVNLAGVSAALYVFDSGVMGAMFAYILAQGAGFVVALTLVYSHIKKSNCGGEEEPEVKIINYASKTVGYGWKAHLSNILAFVNYRSDVFLVNFFLSPLATGIYVIAVQIAEKLWLLSQAASTVLLPKMASMHENPKARIRLAHKGFWIVSCLTFGASIVGVILLYLLLIPVFGEEYQSVLPAFLWLLPGIVAGAGSKIYANCIASAGKPEWNMYSSFFIVIINVVCNILLIPIYGVLGAAMATTLAYILGAGSKFILIRYI